VPIDTATQRDNLAAAYAAAAKFAAATTGDPGTTGTGEIDGTRKAVTWTKPSDGVRTATVTLDIPSAASVGGIALWDVGTGGNYLDGGPVTAQAYSAAGTYTITLTYAQS
jgi:hypothetical protein